MFTCTGVVPMVDRRTIGLSDHYRIDKLQAWLALRGLL
jgi:hypothetical protein